MTIHPIWPILWLTALAVLMFLDDVLHSTSHLKPAFKPAAYLVSGLLAVAIAPLALAAWVGDGVKRLIFRGEGPWHR